MNIIAIAVGSAVGGVALIGLIVGIIVAVVLCNKNKSPNKGENIIIIQLLFLKTSTKHFARYD